MTSRYASVAFVHANSLSVSFFSPIPLAPRTFACCRVSTAGQTTENQVQEIATHGFAVIPQRTINETVSGSVAANERKGFGALLNRLEATDVLIVTKLDRHCRNVMDVRAEVDRLDAMGVRVHCLALGGVDLACQSRLRARQSLLPP